MRLCATHIRISLKVVCDQTTTGWETKVLAVVGVLMTGYSIELSAENIASDDDRWGPGGTMNMETLVQIAGVVGAVAAVIACIQAAAAKRAAIEANIKIGALKLELTQVTTNLTNLTNSPVFHLMGPSISIPGASGGTGGQSGLGGAAGGGGGSIFGSGGTGGSVGDRA